MSTGLNQYAVYRLRRDLKETRTRRHHTFAYLKEHNLKVISDFYEQLYLSRFEPGLDKNQLRKRLEKELPKGVTGERLGISDVLAITKEGITTAYYVDTEKLVVLAGFFHVSSSSGKAPKESASPAASAPGSSESSGSSDVRKAPIDYNIEGRPGVWNVADEIWIDGQQFLLMQSQEFGTDAAYAVLDSTGRQAAKDTMDGFTDSVIQEIREHIKRQKDRTRDLMEKNIGKPESPQKPHDPQNPMPSDDPPSGRKDDSRTEMETAGKPANQPEQQTPPAAPARRNRRKQRRKNGIIPLRYRESVLKRLRAYQQMLAAAGIQPLK